MAPNAADVSEHRILLDLQEDNGFFDFVVDMIPADQYVSSSANDGDDDASNLNSKYFRGQAKESKEARRAKAKQAKRAKLDPDQMETTTQVQKRLHGGKQVSPLLPSGAGADASPTKNPPPTGKGNGKKRKNKGSTKGGACENNKGNGSTTTDDGNSNNNHKNQNHNQDDTKATTTQKSRIEELKAKLHAKIEAKRSQRPDKPGAVSKRAVRRADKLRRQEEAAAAKKKKAHTKAERGETAKLYQVGGSSSKNGSKSSAAEDLANMDFGRLAGLNAANTSNYEKANKSLANLSKTKNLQKMLADAEAKREKLERLKQGSEDDKEKAAGMAWGDAFHEVSGDRVKDDPAKIKKALKRKSVQKAKSAKAWKTRREQTKEKMDERQKIRNHNLKKRTTGGQAGANLSKKRIVLSDFDTPKKNKGDDRRQSRNGFEGKRPEFLNSATKKKVQ
mmetsp:Transcript_14359/g.40860  ORF Transcript_14359/g.40860 Transcript_14359/m.40860 type:complete len:448 (-) Transcript_14359:151-1494(-)|eukprot:CAMPEP_0119559146 /NCGR_PEP_ID=MMETSP1352-20130426/11977_1 /TAXON_ID=265584 /ORGANISM="Stauroneis constricta, Strain CCMP1120" /LENGTH=447 /DNA_ID=CAMNT_0007606751 /DNA_START=107 /DNA_END=1450 /DNA_ORIENTATION=+